MEGNLPVNLMGENTTMLGNATSLTATLAAGTSLPITYTMEYGDQTPAETGIWNTHSTLTFSHIYTAAASYTIILNTISKDGNASIATIMHVIDNDALQGALTSLAAGHFVTYTFIVTNTSATVPATNVNLWGSVPADARLLNTGSALGFTTGGDFGTGYAKSPNPVTLLPGQSIRLTWTVEVIALTDAVLTHGHASSDASRIVIDSVNRMYYLFLPFTRKDSVSVE